MQTLFLAHKVAPGQLNVREGGLYQNFREKLQAIVDGSQYYPVRYQARLLKQTLRLLEDPEPDFSSNLRRIGQGLLGAANLVSVGRGLATGELKLAELQEGITFLQRAVRGRRIEQKPWYSQLLILEKQMLQCLQEEDLQAYPEPAALEERVQAIHMSSLSLKGMATKKVPQYRQALRFGITLQLQTLALSGPTAEVRKGIINQLELLAQPSSWGLDADVMEGLLDGLALVAAQSQADRAAEAAMASQALEKLATSTSASQWLAGKTLKEKLQHLRDQTTTQYTPRAEERLFSYVKKALQIDATITSLKAQEVKNLPELSNHIALTKLLHFIQRKEITDKLTEILQKQDVCVLYGFGGVGKSTLAAHYGHARKDLQTVRWIGAEDSRKLQEGYEQLAQELQVDYRSLAKQLTANPRQYRQELARVVYSALEKSNQAALLILDNAEEASLLEDYLLHRPPHVQALITTRDAEAFEEMYEQLQVDAFSQDEGHRYLEARFRTLKRPYTNQEGASLLETVGLVPQKLKLAAGYLQANKLITTAQYIARLQALQEASTKAQGKLPLPEAALGLETLGEKGQQLMQCVAYLDADFIPLSLVCSLLEEEDPEKLSEVATDLSRLSLMHSVYNAEAALGLQVHREVQACCREYKGWSAEAGLGSPEKILWKLTHVLASQMPWVSATPDDRWQRAKLYAPHVAKVVSRLRSSGAAPAAVAARLLNSMGQYSKEVVRNYPEALEYQKQALQACQDRYQGDHPEVARAWSEIGTTLSQLGQRQQALEHKQQALAMRQRLLEGKDEQDDPELAHALNSVAELLSHLGRHQEALKYKQEGLAMRQWLFKGQDHPDVARSLNSVGISLEDLKQLPEALIYKKEALEMRQRLASNQDHPDIAHSLNNVGETLIKLGQAEEGLDHCKQGWAMRECLFKGQDHPYMAQSLNGVGLGYTALGRHQEAATHYQQAVEVALRVFKGAHPQLTQYYRHLIETLPKLDETTVQQIIATLVPLCSEILGAEHTLTKDLLAASKDS
ncbi:MAG: tetratricopeptide repeat protein [Bacteroidota bacterium]